MQNGPTLHWHPVLGRGKAKGYHSPHLFSSQRSGCQTNWPVCRQGQDNIGQTHQLPRMSLGHEKARHDSERVKLSWGATFKIMTCFPPRKVISHETNHFGSFRQLPLAQRKQPQMINAFMTISMEILMRAAQLY